MALAGIAIDNWKLPIFKKHLEGAGYIVKENQGVTNDTLLLHVVTDDIAELTPVIKKANEACAKWKKNQKLN